MIKLPISLALTAAVVLAATNIKQAMDRAKATLQAARDAESPQLARQALEEYDDEV